LPAARRTFPRAARRYAPSSQTPEVSPHATRIAGFGGLRAGQTNIEASVRRSSGRWVALEVERSGGGGEHGGDDDD
jgi:hypothetical protein